MLAVEGLSFAYRRGAEELFDGLTHSFTPGVMAAMGYDYDALRGVASRPCSTCSA